MIVTYRDDIERAMGELPPPWEWEQLRESVSLTATDMQVLSGIDQSRIRNWERGKGTMDPAIWIAYARVLVKAVQRIQQTGEPPEEVADSYWQRVKKTEQFPLEHPDAVAQVQVLRGAAMSMEDWLARESYKDYSTADLQVILAVLRKTTGACMKTTYRLKKVLAARQQEGNS